MELFQGQIIGPQELFGQIGHLLGRKIDQSSQRLVAALAHKGSRADEFVKSQHCPNIISPNRRNDNHIDALFLPSVRNAILLGLLAR
jgi:hypothetical protein